MTAFRGLKSLKPAPLLNFIVRPRRRRGVGMKITRCPKAEAADTSPSDGEVLADRPVVKPNQWGEGVYISGSLRGPERLSGQL
jgi:hypothetical protein